MSLNLKVYVNILLIIFILSIVLSNVGLKIEIGRGGRDSPYDRNQSDYPIGSFMEGMEGGDGSRSDLEKYADELAGLTKDTQEIKEVTKEEEKNVEKEVEKFGNGGAARGGSAAFPQMPVKPGNFFGVEEGMANFGSNVMDINKFYSNSFGDIEFKTPYNGGSAAGVGQMSAKQSLGGFSQIDGKTANGTSTYKPDMWQYKEEMVMNGGDLYGGVSGFDDLDSSLAVYDNGAQMGGCAGGDMSGCKVGNDDLRMGLGIPGREQRFTQ